MTAAKKAKGADVEPGIAIYCTDETITRADLDAYVAAQNAQLVDFADAWSTLPITCAYYPDPKQIPAGMPTILIAHTCDDPQALAYHTEQTNGAITGLVGVDTCKEAGVSWQSAASHEVLETAKDPFVNAWCESTRNVLAALEVCDPVQDGAYKIGDVEVSNFVYPSWFNIDGAAPYDKLSALSAPFSRTSGGYFVEMRAGVTNQVGARAKHKPLALRARGVRRVGAGLDASQRASAAARATGH